MTVRWDDRKDVEVLMGKTLAKIENIDGEILYFHTTEGEIYKMWHEQDCCESVSLAEVIGDLDDLIGKPLTMAEKTSQEGPEDSWGTSTWTFYKFATLNGYVTLRWVGESNGYYSEGVDFGILTDTQDEEFCPVF